VQSLEFLARVSGFTSSLIFSASYRCMRKLGQREAVAHTNMHTYIHTYNGVRYHVRAPPHRVNHSLYRNLRRWLAARSRLASLHVFVLREYLGRVYVCVCVCVGWWPREFLTRENARRCRTMPSFSCDEGNNDREPLSSHTPCCLKFSETFRIKISLCLSSLARKRERERERHFPERVNRAIKNKIKLPAHMVQNYGKGRRSIDFCIMFYLRRWNRRFLILVKRLFQEEDDFVDLI